MAKAKSKSGTAFIKSNSYEVMLAGGEAGEIIKENLGGDQVTQFDLDRIKIPGAGGQAWEVPTLDGVDPQKEIRGVIIAHKDNRAYWESAYGEGELTPPDCFSEDTITGNGELAKGLLDNLCKLCPMSQFGTAVKEDGSPGRGQACQQKKLVFIVQPESIMPMVIALPPTSLQNFKKYAVRLAGKGTRLWQIETIFTLEKVSGPPAYSKAVMTPGARLDAEAQQQIKEYISQIKPAIDSTRLDVKDYREEV